MFKAAASKAAIMGALWACRARRGRLAGSTEMQACYLLVGASCLLLPPRQRRPVPTPSPLIT